jgi:hypothetical protein
MTTPVSKLDEEDQLELASSLKASSPETDMPTALRDVRSQGQSGKHLLALSLSGNSISDIGPGPHFSPIGLFLARLFAAKC